MVCLCVIIPALMYYFSGLLVSEYWHWKNPQPLKWKQFEVTVPQSMVVAKLGLQPEDLTMLEVLQYQKVESSPIISLDSFPFRKKGTKEELEKRYQEKGYTLIDTPSCLIKDFACLRIQKLDMENGISVIDEMIIFLDFDGVISFSGPEKRYPLFLSVLESMQ